MTLTPLPSRPGCPHCSVTGKVVPPIGKLLTRYSESDKYKRALQRLLLDLTPYEPFFINLPDQPYAALFVAKNHWLDGLLALHSA